MLPAPKVAGLLGSGTQPTFTFADPRLAQLTPAQREKLFDAAAVLLEVAVRFGLRELNDNALRAAASLFARKLTGRAATRFESPDHFRAENDADLLDWLLGVEKRGRERTASDEAERSANRRVRLTARPEVRRD